MATKTETSVFKAAGISCQGCAGTIKEALGAMDGVSEVSIDVPAKTVSVRHDGRARDDDIALALEHAGYPASKLSEGHSHSGGPEPSCCSGPVPIALPILTSTVTEKDPVCGMDVD